jgi:hypothetical protein
MKPMHERYAYGGPLHRFESIKPLRHGIVLNASHPAILDARTIFPTTVNEVGHPRLKRLLKGGENSRKIGKTVTKGKLKGFPIFTLTLEERATCPRTCEVFDSCYGNGMPYAQRHQARARVRAGAVERAGGQAGIPPLRLPCPPSCPRRFLQRRLCRAVGRGAGGLSGAPHLRLHRARSAKRYRPGRLPDARRVARALPRPVQRLERAQQRRGCRRQRRSDRACRLPGSDGQDGLLRHVRAVLA